MTVVTNAGGGASHGADVSVDPPAGGSHPDPGSHFIYLRDVRSGRVWSATYQPIAQEPEEYRVDVLRQGRVPPHATTASRSQLEVVVSAEDDVEVRRLSLTNKATARARSRSRATPRSCSARHEDDIAHPAFGKLFIETEYLPDSSASALQPPAPRRSRGDRLGLPRAERRGRPQSPTEWETRRARFLGRGRSDGRPVALDGRALSGTTGAVLDPVVSLRQRVRLQPGGFARLSFATGVAPDPRDGAVRWRSKYHDRGAAARAFSMAFTHSQMLLRHLGITERTRRVNTIGSPPACFYLDDSLRASPQTLATNDARPGGLWGHGISGDLPILLVTVERGR